MLSPPYGTDAWGDAPSLGLERKVFVSYLGGVQFGLSILLEDQESSIEPSQQYSYLLYPPHKHRRSSIRGGRLLQKIWAGSTCRFDLSTTHGVRMLVGA